MLHHIQDSSTATPTAVAAAATSSSTSTTPRQLGVLRDGNFPMSLRRSSAPGYSAASFSSLASSSSRSAAAGSASASASAASWKRRSDGDAHLQRSFATHTPEASLEFLDHLQSLIISRPSVPGSSSSSSSATRRSPPMIKRPRRSSSASRLSLSAANNNSPSSFSSASHNNHARSESAQFVDSWLKTLDASAAVAAAAAAAVAGPASASASARAGGGVVAGEKNTGMLGFLDSRIAELTMEIENLRMKPLLRSAPPPPPSPAALSTQPKIAPLQFTDKSVNPPPPPTAAAVANPFQSLVDHLDTLSLASAASRLSTPLPPTTPPSHAPPSPTPTPTPEPARQSAAV
ncbi:hypothetical protein HDU87_003701 [Geranomyces variabilis]|uniref:Uncharacterized protein n=1 Tax=Geranomyces variabilis TaxID=109894 RepID=A0AAD5XQ90_9FUNG|nr:hypothetical protein HDU87_003701 [Geranomyces variabilis]